MTTNGMSLGVSCVSNQWHMGKCSGNLFKFAICFFFCNSEDKHFSFKSILLTGDSVSSLILLTKKGYSTFLEKVCDAFRSTLHSSPRSENLKAIHTGDFMPYGHLKVCWKQIPPAPLPGSLSPLSAFYKRKREEILRLHFCCGH